MRYDMSLPWWSWALMGAGLVAFVIMIAASIRRNSGVKRSLFAAPYSLWMILFTIVPVVLIGYYAFTDASGAFTLDNFRNFWDSNYESNKVILDVMGEAGADYITRGTVNVDTLVYSLWMAFLCTVICLLLGYPAALFMADRNMKLGSSLVVLFIIPMWMNFLLRTIAWMSLLEDSGLINTFLRWLGFDGVQLMYNSQAVLLGMVYNFLPFMVFPIYTVLHRKNGVDDVREQAIVDLCARTGNSVSEDVMRTCVYGCGEFFDWLYDFPGADKAFDITLFGESRAMGPIYGPAVVGFPKRLDENLLSRDPSIGPGWSGTWIKNAMLKAIPAQKLDVEILLKHAARHLITDETGRVTGVIADEEMTALLRKTCDMTPAGIINKLQLRRPIYSATASEGHFGVADRPWEATDLAEELKKLAKI